MSKYIATFDFGTNGTKEEVEHWFALVLDAMPSDVVATLKTEPLVLDVKQVTDEHAGNVVSFYHPKDKANVTGVLEHVYPVVRNPEARTLVVEGHAYTVNYGVVQLGEW